MGGLRHSFSGPSEPRALKTSLPRKISLLQRFSQRNYHLSRTRERGTMLRTYGGAE